MPGAVAVNSSFFDNHGPASLVALVAAESAAGQGLKRSSSRACHKNLLGLGVWFYVVLGTNLENIKNSLKKSRSGNNLENRDSGIRTHGLVVPNDARYQLRYIPLLGLS